MKRQCVSTVERKQSGKRSTNVYLTAEVVDEARALDQFQNKVSV
ncbi:hypothetical protein [Photorhabdus sp. SF281]